MDFSSVNDPKLTTLLSHGAVGILPTDTIYGIVANASNRQAVERMYALKSREKKPGTLIAANLEQIVKLGLKKRYLTVVEDYWPGPVTVVVPTSTHDTDYLDQGVGSLAVRVIDDPKIIELLEKTGPLITSSANHPGEAPANTIAEAKQYFGDQVDFYTDGGDLSGRKPSTILRVVDDTIEILREGAVKINT